MPEYAPGRLPVFHHYLAVDFFFMLSGYVMARTFEPRFAAGLSPAKFMWDRYWRFWPTMAFGTLAALPLLAIIAPDERLPDVLRGLLLVPTFTTANLFPLNVVAWSIAFELAANALHAFAFRSMRTVALLVCVCCLAAILTCVTASAGSLNLGATPQTAGAGAIRALVPYIAGIVLYRVWRDQPPVAIHPLLTVIAIPTACLLSSNWATDMLFVLCCPLIVAGGIRLKAGRGGELLGVLSFPLYAVQIPVLDSSRLLGATWFVGLPLAIGAAGILAFLPELKRRAQRKVLAPRILANL